MYTKSFELESNSSESCIANNKNNNTDHHHNSATDLTTRVSQWREEWHALNDAIRELAGAGTSLKRAREIAQERDTVCGIAKRSAVRAKMQENRARESLNRAHHSALGGIVPGTKARRSAALRRAEDSALSAQKSLAEAKQAQAEAWNQVALRANDHAALIAARTRQRALLANAASSGAFQEDDHLVNVNVEAREAAIAASTYAFTQSSVHDELITAKNQLTKALFLMVDARDRSGIELYDNCDIDESSVAKMLPSARITDAEVAVANARRSMRSATTQAPDLPLNREEYVQAALLNAFVHVNRATANIPKGFFELAEKRIRDALNALMPSLEIQNETCTKANAISEELEEKAEALEEALAKRRHDALFSCVISESS